MLGTPASKPSGTAWKPKNDAVYDSRLSSRVVTAGRGACLSATPGRLRPEP